jgi:5-methylcytosine-specific restriction endonuclease McrA
LLGKEVNSYSKAQQLGQKPKAAPKIKTKKPKKAKKPYVHRGRVIPKKKERTKIDATDYHKMIERYGAYCQECGHTPIDAHHLLFRAQFGTGNWRNLAPLCGKCHRRAHKSFEFAEYLRHKRAAELGPHFGKDKYTLFKERLIPNTEDSSYERFMKGEEESAAHQSKGNH